jgi:hypothetical protein
MNIFETAARKKLRFHSEIGALTTEQLWDLPLLRQRGQGTDLDTVARAVAAELREVAIESFVQVTATPRQADLEVKLEIVKHVIAAKQAQAEVVRRRADNVEKRRKLLDALESAEAREMSALSKEDLLKRLSEIDDAA